MKRVCAVFALVLVASATFAYLGQIVGSFTSPAGGNTRGLACSTSYFYVLDYVTDRVYRLNTNGSLVGSITLPTAGTYGGLAFYTPTYLLAGDSTNDQVYRVDHTTGSVYGSWNATHDAYGLAPLSTGDGGSGTTYILGTDDSPSYIFVHSLTGVIVNRVPLSPSTNYDCAFDWRQTGGYVWVGDTDRWIRAYRPTGSVMGSFQVPTSSPYGLTYIGEYLYVACASSPYPIYKVHCPQGFVGVKPMSMGRVKAMFR